MNYTGKKFSLWTKYGALNSRNVFDAFRTSLLRRGFSVSDNDPNADVDVIWSVLWHGRMAKNEDVWLRAQAQQKPVIVLEIGSIVRGSTWKVGLGGVNRRAYFGPDKNDSARATALGLKLQPWQEQGEDILVCCQHPKSAQWEGMPRVEEWVNRIVLELRQYTDRAIKIRPHPRAPIDVKKLTPGALLEIPRKLPQTYDSFDLHFNNVHAVVNWSSNPAVQAVQQGIPVYTGPDSLAYPVSNSDLSSINTPIRPDREQWLNDLAHTEYTIREIEQGIPIDRLTNKLF